MHWLATLATFCIEHCLQDSSPYALVSHLGHLLQEVGCPHPPLSFALEPVHYV